SRTRSRRDARPHDRKKGWPTDSVAHQSISLAATSGSWPPAASRWRLRGAGQHARSPPSLTGRFLAGSGMAWVADGRAPSAPGVLPPDAAPSAWRSRRAPCPFPAQRWHRGLPRASPTWSQPRRRPSRSRITSPWKLPPLAWHWHGWPCRPLRPHQPVPPPLPNRTEVGLDTLHIGDSSLILDVAGVQRRLWL